MTTQHSFDLADGWCHTHRDHCSMGPSDLEDPQILMLEDAAAEMVRQEDDEQPPYRTSGWQPRK